MQKDEKKQNIIIVIGDSLGAPRPWVGVTLKNTYAFKLSKLLGPNYFVANYSVSANSTKKFVKESFLRTYIRNSDISYVIIQVGIVDCAPRLLSSFDRLLAGIASRVTFLSFAFNKYIGIKSKHRYWLTKNFPKTLVSLPEFEINYRRLINELIAGNPIKKIYILEVAYPGVSLIERSYNIIENIKAYNKVLHRIKNDYLDKIEIIRFYDKIKLNQEWITVDDGHHIVSDAHDWIARELYSNIESVEYSRI